MIETECGIRRYAHHNSDYDTRPAAEGVDIDKV